MTKENEGKRRVLSILVLFFVVLSVSLYAILMGIWNRNEKKHLQLVTERYEHAYHTIYDQYKQLATTVSSGILTRYAIKDLYLKLLTADEEEKNRLRADLLSRIIPRYSELQKETNLRQLHFHLRNNESFLRMHRPEKFGDNLTGIRETVNYVNTRHVPIDGFEEGRIYCGYRFVFPITGDDQTHLGSMEISFGPDALTSSMMKQYDVLSNFFVRETVIAKKTFLDDKKNNYQKSPHKDYLQDRKTLAVLKKVSRKELKELRPSPETMAKILSSIDAGRSVSLFDVPAEMVYTAIPVRNPVTREMVAFLTVRSHSDLFILERRHFWAVFSVSFLLLAVILSTFFSEYDKRKLLERNKRQLERQKKQLLGAQEIANLGHWEFDLSSRRLQWSAQIYRIFELDPQENAITLDLYMQRVHPDDREFVSASYADHVENKTPYDIRHRILCENDTEKWVREICTTEYDVDGKALRSLGIVHDITEQHIAWTLLQRERDMFMQGPVMTFTWQNKDNWPVEQVSANVFALLGYKDREFLDGSLHYSSLIHDEDVERVGHEVSTGSQEGNSSFSHTPYRLIARDGSVVWVQDQTMIIRNRDGEITHYQGYLVNITNTMHLTEELRDSKERLEMIISGANLGTWDWNIKTGDVFFNERWAEILGYRLHELKPHISTWEGIIHPDEMETVNRILTDHLEGRTPVYMADHRLRHKSGAWVWVLDVGKVFERDSDGSPVRAVGIHMDITKQKEVEQALQNARKTAEAANRAKSAFLANMSHELRTPLNAILGYTQIFAGDESLTAQQQSGIQTMHQSGEHLLMLIDDILDLSKIEADKMELVETDFLFPEFLQSIADIMRVKSRSKDLDFHYLPGIQLPAAVRADALRLRQVLFNLLSNAVKFTREGYCILNVQSRSVHKNRVQVTFVVEDSGPGIAADEQEKVFRPFQQGGARLQYAEGSGLGLAISRRLVHLMGGELELTSPIQTLPKAGTGAGSRFSFTVELDTSGCCNSTEAATRKITGYTVFGAENIPKKILIVDDDRINRLVLTDTLKPLGFIVGEAIDGTGVLAACEELQPDIILMDLLMPEIDGYEATKLLKEHPVYRNIPVIAITALVCGGEESEEQCLEYGFSDYISKPYSLAELMKVLATQLNLRLQYAVNPEDLRDEEEMLAPPSEYMEQLLLHVRSGDINSVVEKAKEIEKLGSGKYSVFARRLQQLADNYRLIEIEKLLTTLRTAME